MDYSWPSPLDVTGLFLNHTTWVWTVEIMNNGVHSLAIAIAILDKYYHLSTEFPKIDFLAMNRGRLKE
jgi:hypothetical protein